MQGILNETTLLDFTTDTHLKFTCFRNVQSQQFRITQKLPGQQETTLLIGNNEVEAHKKWNQIKATGEFIRG